MIRIVTLSDSKNEVGSTALPPELAEQLSSVEMDILCCQGMQRTVDGKKDSARKMAELLRMTYSFSATGCIVNNTGGEKEKTINGLSILAGAHVWMLNSGSFALPGEDPDKNQIAQFAVIRQNGNSVLVINTELSPIASVQLHQLEAVFSHQLLLEQYGAVVLCSSGKIAVSQQDLQFVSAQSAYKPTHETTAVDSGESKPSSTLASWKQSGASLPADGAILILTLRKQAPAIVQIHDTSASLKPTSILGAELEFKRVPSEKRNKFYFPLSFSEQRFELKEGGREPAVS